MSGTKSSTNRMGPKLASPKPSSGQGNIDETEQPSTSDSISADKDAGPAQASYRHEPPIFMERLDASYPGIYLLNDINIDRLHYPFIIHYFYCYSGSHGLVCDRDAQIGVKKAVIIRSEGIAIEPYQFLTKNGVKVPNPLHFYSGTLLDCHFMDDASCQEYFDAIESYNAAWDNGLEPAAPCYMDFLTAEGKKDREDYVRTIHGLDARWQKLFSKAIYEWYKKSGTPIEPGQGLAPVPPDEAFHLAIARKREVDDAHAHWAGKKAEVDVALQSPREWFTKFQEVIDADRGPNTQSVPRSLHGIQWDKLYPAEVSKMFWI